MSSMSGVAEALRWTYKPSLALVLLGCVYIFFTTPPQDQVRQPLLYKPLLASLFLGISSFVVSIFYGFQWSQPATLEAALLDQDKIKKQDHIKDWLLLFGLICMMLALLLRLSLDSLQDIATVFIASIAVVMPIICVIGRFLSEIIPQTQNS